MTEFNKIIVESDLNELARVRAFILEFCRGIPDSLLDYDRIDNIVLAVDETVANIIKHAYQGRKSQQIQITAEVSAGHMVIRLYDRGKEFDLESVQAPKFDGSKDSGFGIYIISRLVDEVMYSRDKNGKNCAELIVKFTGGD